MRGIFRQRRDLLTATLAEHAPMLQVTGIAAGGHALVRLPPGGPDEHEVITKAAVAGLALDGLSEYPISERVMEPSVHQSALVIGYGTPARRSYRAAVAALGEFFRSAYPANPPPLAAWARRKPIPAAGPGQAGTALSGA
jgi:GntR family transcriptional regulator / MocR family aminotransferase